MILLNTTKLSVDGVDVYPDHEDKRQFWYVPSELKLAERDRRKVLSYFWYTESNTDTAGTGFLNFEVNTAVSPETLSRIRAQLARKHALEVKDVKLSTVDYKAGRVNVSALGPMARKSYQDAETTQALRKDPAVVYQGKQQLVWTAGSSSLVADNTAVCSVKFTREGKLAAAMHEAILSQANTIAAIYYLEFLAMQPAVRFRVKGELQKTIQAFTASIGVDVPLEYVLLEVGAAASWKRIMSDTKLEIELIHFGGDDKEEGLKLAQKILLDYVLQNFFTVDIGGPKKVGDVPEVKKAVDRAVTLESEAEDADADDSEADDSDDEDADDDDAPEPGAEDPPKSETSTETSTSSATNAVKAAGLPIPKVRISAAYDHQQQINTIDFEYTEMRANVVAIAPQALVLQDLQSPRDHVFTVNRGHIPMGLTFPVAVALPTRAICKDTGLSLVNVRARYANGARDGVQTPAQFVVLKDGKLSGTNPMQFQYDSAGNSSIDYTIDFLFDPSEDWHATRLAHPPRTGTTDSGVIAAQPQAFFEFLKIDAVLQAEFTWTDDYDRALVTLCSERWDKPKTLVFQKGAPLIRQGLRVRGELQATPTPVVYTVELQKRRETVYSYGPEPVVDNLITVHDRFLSHVPIFFTAKFEAGIKKVTARLVYRDSESQFNFEARKIIVKGTHSDPIYIPTLREFPVKSDLEVTCTFLPDKGTRYTETLFGGDDVDVTGVEA